MYNYQVGEVIRIRKQALSEIMDSGDSTYITWIKGLSLVVPENAVLIVKEQYTIGYCCYTECMYEDPSKFGCSSISICTLLHNGVLNTDGHLELTEVFFEHVNTCFCTCEDPQLVTRTVLFDTYSYCTKCKKERR